MPIIPPYPNKIWQQNETIERNEMNDISSALYEITSDYNDFFMQFTSADDTQTAAVRIKNYVDSFTYHTSFADDDEPIGEINDDTASFSSIGIYYDTISSTEDGITALEKKCERIEKIVTSIGDRVVTIGSGGARLVQRAMNWAESDNVIPDTTSSHSAKYYAELASSFVSSAAEFEDLAKQWAISSSEIGEQGSGNYSAMHYANYIHNEVNKIDNLYWTGDMTQPQTLTLENCIIPGISMNGGTHIIFNLNLDKIIDTNFLTLSNEEINGLKVARDLSINTSTETIDNVITPLTQIRIYAKNQWILNYTNDYNKIDATDNYYGNNKGAAPNSIVNKIIVHPSHSSTMISLVLINNNLSKWRNSEGKITYSSAGWGTPYTNTKSTGGKIGGSVPVLMFVKKLVIKYTPYIEPITPGTTTIVDTEPAAGTGNNNNP